MGEKNEKSVVEYVDYGSRGGAICNGCQSKFNYDINTLDGMYWDDNLQCHRLKCPNCGGKNA